ncbi:hypothetical protein C8Q75DRAFT_751752 [Abortiporus biennis]|nr:hypothetical protein C8Q75DRAFT_751752 [Abortiporus biennis]
MNRFRKKSDPKRSQVPLDIVPAVPQFDHYQLEQQHEPLPVLPPVSDFRTSLILPDLTRRFSVLRNSSGNPIGLDDLKSRFAEQRARGAENQVTEEEEDMILEALGRFHVRAATRGRGNSTSGDDARANGNGVSTYSHGSEDQEAGSRISASPSLAGRQSVQSTGTTTSSILHGSTSTASLSSVRGSQLSRRMSNNLFGSGKFRDHTYIRHQHHQRRGEGSTRSPSFAPSESNASMNTVTSSRAANNTSLYSDNQSLRPSTPDGSAYSPTSSVPGSPNDRAAETVSESGSDFRVFGGRMSRALSPEHLKRASMALDEVIRELEEEDDEIVMERSPITRVPTTKPIPEVDPTPDVSSPTEYGTALSSDEPVITDETQRASPFPGSRTTSPTPRLPGYVPGMPRPMTPHDVSFDSADDQTPSATPRATSPRLPGVAHTTPIITQSISSAMYRSNSTASTARQSPRPTSPSSIAPISASPLFFNRTTNGRFTPEDRNRNGPAFQPLASMGPSTSRPSTPSNITWIPSSSSNTGISSRPGRSGSVSGHSRSGSTTSIGVTSTEAAVGHPDSILERSKSVTRSLRSPALPDSPWIDQGQATTIAGMDYRPPSAMSGMELGSPIQIANRSIRSPTPTSTYSPTSPTFPDANNSATNVNGSGFSPSRRSSKQAAHNSGFSLGPAHTLLFSPLANSSRSSLESAGSSYHSWDDDHKKDRLFTLFNGLDPQYTEWHDITISVQDKSSSTSGTASTPYDGTTESEEIVRRDIGLTKNDFLTIQDKLVGAALTKAATPESRNRASSIRKRRPSTSQSNYSYNGGDSRIASPAPQSHPAVTAPSRAGNSDNVAKANALLNSMVDSIQSPKAAIPEPPAEPAVSETVIEAPITNPSPTQRHRALADALFGVEDRPRPKTPTETSSPPNPQTSPSTASQSSIHALTLPSGRVESPHHDLGTPKASASMRDLTTPVASSQPHSGPSSALGHSTNSSQPPMDPALLAIDVRRRAEAATAALRKSPSNPKINDGAGTVRKRISPNQISSPKLVSASTSVDTIPLRPTTAAPAQSHHGNKFGSRFKRLRGTLRSKPIPNGDEVTPFPLDPKTPSSAQTISYDPSSLVPPGPSVYSATELGRFKNPAPSVPTPPASAAPGLKGFMSLFRKHKTTDVSPPHSRGGPQSSSSASPPTLSPLPHEFAASGQVKSAPAHKSQFNSGTITSRSLSPQFAAPKNSANEAVVPSFAQEDPPRNDEAALRQLFDAATNLGLDQAALNELIARSPSTSRSTAWSKLARDNSVSDKRRSHRSTTQSSSISRSPAPSEGRPSIDAILPTARPSVEINQLNIRKKTEISGSRSRGEQSDVNPVVRRTIIFASDTRASTSAFDLNALRRQSTAKKRRSAGAGSVHSKTSVHDRAPTPPPPRSSTSRRFSNDGSPPVPNLPHTFSNDGSTAPSQIELLYDMYTGENRVPGSVNAESSGSQAAYGDAIPESGPALEVVELANGETIWSIVNGLRDDDTESFYGDRASLASEYSLKDSSEGVKLFFKEHGRKSSKSSNASFLSRKKNSVNRPETKVFFSSSAQIGRLIENLSRGMESGSFNITPDHLQANPGHSATPSFGSENDMRWTVEERLEQMLGSIAPTA